jgi:hypothetical protein
MRQRDLERLRPVGPPTVTSNGRKIYGLEDGRQAVVRESTSRRGRGTPTLEIQIPTRVPERFETTDKFRYLPGQ